MGSVCFFLVLDTVNEDLSGLVIYPVDGPVITGPDSIAIFGRHSFAARRTRIALQVGDFFNQFLECPACETVQVFLCLGEQKDLIHFDS